jgi:transcriptional regulator with XRE-family HTH domain
VAGITIGQKVRFYREKRGLKQVVLARMVGVSEDYISMVERGVRTPSSQLTHKIARAVRVPSSVLFDDRPEEDDAGRHAGVDPVRRALWDHASKRATPNLEELRTRVEAAWVHWQAPRRSYRSVGESVAHLITDVEQAVRAYRSEDGDRRREAHRIAADLYGLSRTYTKRSGAIDLAILTADRQTRHAESTDDPVRIGAARWNLGHALLGDGQPEAAEDIALQSADELEGLIERDPDARAMYGALLLVATVASVRSGDHHTARRRLDEVVEPTARHVGETNVQWTSFGPANVALHAVTIEADKWEPAAAIRLADRVAVEAFASAERAFTFHLELARCYEMRNEDHGVLVELLQAEHLSADDMKLGRGSHELVNSLMNRARPSYAHQVRALADRIGVYG